MKLFLHYLKEHRQMLFVLISFYFIFIICFMLYHLPIEAVIYPMFLCTSLGIIFFILDFSKVKRDHETLQRIQMISDTFAENFPLTDAIIENDYQKLLHLFAEEHHAYLCETNRNYTDMIEYYTVWAHQVKTPIASMRLHLQNEDSAQSRKLTADLHRIEQYVEMVLTYLRLNSESTDYIFAEYDLDQIIRSTVKKFSSDFIARKLSLVYNPLNTTVITDEKWLSFVIEQVLSNALKYTPSGSITISLVNEKTLRITDTGIGIASEDLPRIFENGYTGYNGRSDHKASGIGLYLCKRICSNLGHTITASSTIDIGTTIDINLSQYKLEIE